MGCSADADGKCVQQYQELFALCQGLPGPASTKMLFCIALIHAGFLPAVMTFLAWRWVFWHIFKYMDEPKLSTNKQLAGGPWNVWALIRSSEAR